jgi:hypothetical protein
MATTIGSSSVGGHASRPRVSTTKKVLLIIGALAVVGAIAGGGLYLAFPVQMTQIGGLTRNYLLTLSAPRGVRCGCR